jgi:hypothetical protein
VLLGALTSFGMTGHSDYLPSNSATSDFSSFNSATDASIFAPLKSFIGSPWTISHLPPRLRIGNDEIKAAQPVRAQATPVLEQSPSPATGLTSDERILVLETKTPQ